MTRKCFCLAKSKILVRMCGNLPQDTNVHFPRLAHAGSRFYRKDAFIFNHGRSPDVYANCNVKTYSLTPEIDIDFG